MSKVCPAIFIILAILGAAATDSAFAAKPKGPAPWVGKQLDGKKCANKRPSPGGGPYNYRKKAEIAGVLNMVENAHFHESVEKLQHGSTGTLMADMDFVLRAFPNHHRALNSSVNYSMRFRKWPASEKGLPAECYLQRAIVFDPADSVPMELYGYYLHRKGRHKDALKAYQMALNLRPNDVMLNYNTALLFVREKKYEEAMGIARQLYDAGLTLPGLKKKLVAAGKWKASAEELEKIRSFMDKKAPNNPNSPQSSASVARKKTPNEQSQPQAQAGNTDQADL